MFNKAISVIVACQESLKGLSMRSCLMLLVTSLLVMVAAADEELVDAGPYQVSFDLGTTTPYQWEVNESKANAGYLDLWILSEDSFAYLYTYPIEEDLVFDLPSLQLWVNHSFNELFTSGLPEDEVRYYGRNIDGQEAVLGVMDLQDAQLFIAAYSRTYDDSGHIMVEIGSMYPWNQGTESLLNSITVDYSPIISTSIFGIPLMGSSISDDDDYGTPLDRSMRDLMSKHNASGDVNRAYLLRR